MEDLITDNDNTLRAPGIQMEIVNIQTYLCQHGFNRQITINNDALSLKPCQHITLTTNTPSCFIKDKVNTRPTGNQMCPAVNVEPLDIDERDTIIISDKFTVYNNPHNDHTDYDNTPAPNRAYIGTQTREDRSQVEYQSYFHGLPEVCHSEVSDSLIRQNSITDDKQYKCEICQKVFKHRQSLKAHYRIHTGEKPYQCKVCQKHFNRGSHLKEHKRIHTGEKPFQCDVCQKCFRHNTSFARHKRTHTGEKPFQCEACEKCFIRHDSLIEHKRLHTNEKPYQCDVCHKCFNRVSNFNRHKRLHTREKPFQSYVCQKCFTQAHQLKVHRRLHSGEKPFQCDVCQKYFTQA